VANLYADEELYADGVSIISVDPISGALTRRATVAAGSLPTAVAVDPTGRFAYVANRSYCQMSVYSIAANGMLTPIGIVGTGNSAVSLAVDPTGRFAYVANSGDDTLSTYRLAADGKLILLGNTATGHDPQSVTVDSTSQFAYAANWSSGSLSKYRIDVATGRLTPLGTVGTRSGPAAITTFTPPALWLSVNETLFRRGTTMSLTTATTPGSTPQVVDLYMVLQLPDQTLRFLQADGGLTPEVRPLVASWTVASFLGEPFRYMFTGGEPVGDYRWLAVFTEPWTGTIIEPVAQVPFAFSP
jgi:Lactonase, 7-bladed beta-propeller